MKISSGLILPALLLAGCASDAEPESDAIAAASADLEAAREASQPLAQAFATALQAELASAMQSGGPQAAIAVCHDQAPAIAAEHSQASGAMIERVSHKNRNPAGVVSAALAAPYAELQTQPVVDGNPATRVWQDGAQVHFLAAIPMRAEPCGVCHGSAVDPALSDQIAELYPQDLATGFEPGELRGALHVSWPAERFAAAK